MLSCGMHVLRGGGGGGKVATRMLDILAELRQFLVVLLLFAEQLLWLGGPQPAV